jgi:hypothetical protein
MLLAARNLAGRLSPPGEERKQMKLNKVISPAALFLLLGTGANVFGQHEEPGKPAKSESKAEPQQRQPQQHAPQQQQHAQQPKPQAQQEQRAQQPQQRAQPKPPTQQEQRAQQPQQQHAQPQARQQQVQRSQQPQQQTQPQQRAQSHQSQRQGNQARQQSYAPPERTRQQAQTWQQQSSWRQDGAWQEHSSWQQSRSSNWGSDHRTWAQRGGYGGYYIPEASFSLHFGIGNWFRIQNQPVIIGGYPRFQYGGYSFMMVDPWPSDWAQDWYASDDVYVGYDNGYYLYNRQYPGEAIAIAIVL